MKSLADKIPGYRGYAEKEARREADKELRTATAAAFASQVTRITRVQEQMINQGDFERVDDLDRSIGALQHLADRIRTASYGFTGFFDDDKVDEVVLDRLYAFDLETGQWGRAGGRLDRQGRGSQPAGQGAAARGMRELHDIRTRHLLNTFRSAGSTDSVSMPETPGRKPGQQSRSRGNPCGQFRPLIPLLLPPTLRKEALWQCFK